MRLVVDANILVAELLRERGRALVADERLELFIAAQALGEASHELRKRVRVIAHKTGVAETRLASLLGLAVTAAENSLYAVPLEQYRPFEPEARRRLPRDPDVLAHRGARLAPGRCHLDAGPGLFGLWRGDLDDRDVT